MTGIMQAVYRALADLPCAVSRAWPQAPQPLPALSFSLAGLKRGQGGLDQADIRLAIRAVLPEEADELMEQAVAALAPLGLWLTAARDEAEADSGAFLKTLSLTGHAAEGALIRLAFSLQGEEGCLPLPGLLEVAQSPAARTIGDKRTLGMAGAHYLPGATKPGELRLVFKPASEDPGQQALRAAFLSGEGIRWRLSGGTCAREGAGLVSALGDSAFCLEARITLTE